MESSRLRRNEDPRKIPRFGEKVLVKKRNWRTKMLQPTHEVTKYLSPMIESHGHCILREDGRWNVTPFVVRNFQEPPPPKDEMWLAIAEELEEERDEVQERRRVRRRRPIREGEARRLAEVKKMLREEAECVQRDSTETASLTFQRLEPWKKIMKMEETKEQEILQTKIVSPNEMMGEIDLWDEAIKSELESLLKKKEALRSISTEEKERLERKYPGLLTVPSKLVITRKAGGRRKIRVVACGNHIQKGEKEELYAGGSDAVSLRIALKKGAIEGWSGATLDIKTAFLNAPLPGVQEAMEQDFVLEEEWEEENVVLVLIKPPAILVRLGDVKEGTWWLAIRAMYGLRQSPKAWSDYRDSVLGKMTVDLEDGQIFLEPLVTDPNVWKLMKDERGRGEPKMIGMMLVYVDDVLILSEEENVQQMLDRIGQEWETSKPEWLQSDGPVKFLGMEIRRFPQGMFLSQETYLADLLERNGEAEGACSGIPITKDQALKLEEEAKEKSVEAVKQAQRVTGELMWLLTRTRPDIMFVVSRMSQSVLKNPEEVYQTAKQVWKYLRKTKAQGIWLKKEGEDVLEIYTDSSYGPGGHQSQGTVIIKWHGSTIMWKSGRQASPSLSTAESELCEAIEGIIMGDSVDVVIQEMHQGRYIKMVKVDNTAAVSLLTEPSGSWRTRHLRLRAAHLRWRLGRLDWIVESIPGPVQVADVGTKALTSPRLEELKDLMEMKEAKKEKQAEDEKEDRSEGKTGRREEVEKILRMVVVLGCIQQASGMEEMDGITHIELEIPILIVLASVGLLHVIMAIWNYIQGCRKKKEEVEDSEVEEVPRPVVALEEKKGEEEGGPSGANLSNQAPLPSSSSEAPLPNPTSQASSSNSSNVAQMSSSSNAAPLPAPLPDSGGSTAVRNRKNRRAPIITAWGKRWHSSRLCPTLANTKVFNESPWWERCATEERTGVSVIFAKGTGGVAHYDSRCPMRGEIHQKFEKCQRCIELTGMWSNGLSSPPWYSILAFWIPICGMNLRMDENSHLAGFDVDSRTDVRNPGECWCITSNKCPLGKAPNPAAANRSHLRSKRSEVRWSWEGRFPAQNEKCTIKFEVVLHSRNHHQGSQDHNLQHFYISKAFFST